MIEYKTLPDTGFLRLSEVLRYIPVSKTTWWNGVKFGRFPASVKLGPGITMWKVEDIKELINRLQ
jgi:prophage regulatory protein